MCYRLRVHHRQHGGYCRIPRRASAFRLRGMRRCIRDAAERFPDGLCGRDVALFGCSVGTDEVELQTDFEPLFEVL